MNKDSAAFIYNSSEINCLAQWNKCQSVGVNTSTNCFVFKSEKKTSQNNNLI